MCTLCDSTGLFEMIVGVLTTCHTQYTWNRSICIFLFNRTTLQVYIYSYLKCIVYDRLLKHRQSFRITLYKLCPKIIQTITFHYHLACSHSLWHNIGTNQSSSRFRQLLEIHVSLIICRTRRSFFYGSTILVGEGSKSHSDTPHSVGLLCSSDRPVAETSTWQ